MPQLAIEKLGFDKNIIIVFRQPTKERQGSAEHIIMGHKKQIDDIFISKLKSVITKPNDVKQDDDGRIVMFVNLESSKPNVLKRFSLVIEKEASKENYYTIVSAYPKTIKIKLK